MKRLALFMAGVSGLAAFESLATVAGYRFGLKESDGDTGDPLGLLNVVLLPLLLCILAIIAVSRGKKPVRGRVIAFASILVVQLPLQYQGAVVYGRAARRSNLSKDRFSQRTVAYALEAWRRSHGAYPATLEELAPLPLAGIPASRFGVEFQLGYARLKGPRAAAAPEWMLWYPGPDGTYDLADGPDLQSALFGISAAGPPPWLANRLYDPSNGASSSGDWVRWQTPEGE